MTVRYAIPTHGRQTTIAGNSIAVLERCGVDLAHVDLFTTPDQHDGYVGALAGIGVGAIVPGGDSLLEQRLAIRDHYDDGAPIVVLDDDLREMIEIDTAGDPRPVDDLPSLVERAFEICATAGASLWGVYPVANPFFMSCRVRAGLWFCDGTFFGKINRRSDDYRCGAKGDYEETLIRYAADGAVVRLESVSFRTTGYRTTPGGQQDRDRARLNAESVAYLKDRWPDLVRPGRKRDDGYEEIRLARGARG